MMLVVRLLVEFFLCLINSSQQIVKVVVGREINLELGHEIIQNIPRIRAMKEEVIYVLVIISI